MGSEQPECTGWRAGLCFDRREQTTVAAGGLTRAAHPTLFSTTGGVVAVFHQSGITVSLANQSAGSGRSTAGFESAHEVVPEDGSDSCGCDGSGTYATKSSPRAAHSRATAASPWTAMAEHLSRDNR